jgi:hypothetical protein
VSINVELASTGAEVAEHRKNTVIAGGCYLGCPRCPAVAGTVVIKSYVLDFSYVGENTRGQD